MELGIDRTYIPNWDLVDRNGTMLRFEIALEQILRRVGMLILYGSEGEMEPTVVEIYLLGGRKLCKAGFG